MGDKTKSIISYKTKPNDTMVGAAIRATAMQVMIMGVVNVRKLKASGIDINAMSGILNDISPKVSGIEHNRNSIKWMAR